MMAEYGSDEAERESIYAARAELLLSALDSANERLSVDVLDSRVKILAAISLTQENYFTMRSGRSTHVALTDEGFRFALGVKAFNRS